ncbi:MAG TPA: hypothetical protein DCL48_16755, partial [Alphaproteobacteria bacterium]|nr:hypothetical protein [Alphaproteobacteria bacterium]
MYEQIVVVNVCVPNPEDLRMRASDIIRLAAIMCCMSIALDAQGAALPAQSSQTIHFSSAVFLPLALFAQNDDDDDDDNDGNTGGGGADDGGADDGGAGNGGSGHDDGGAGGGAGDG